MTASERSRSATTNVVALRTPETQQATHTRTRARITAAAVTNRVSVLLKGLRWRNEASSQRSRDVRRVSPFHSPPASLVELVNYTRSGAWVPGERAPALELAGKAYGYLIAIPVSACLYAVAWLLQRPARLGAACIAAGVAWLTQIH